MLLFLTGWPTKNSLGSNKRGLINPSVDYEVHFNTIVLKKTYDELLYYSL